MPDEKYLMGNFSESDADSDVARLLTVIAREHRARWVRIVIRAVLANALLQVVSIAVARALLGGGAALSGIFNSTLSTACSFLSLVVGFAAWTTRTERAALRELAGTSAKDAIGPLIDAALYSTPSIMVVARLALVRLLPAMTEDEAAILKESQRKSLTVMLRAEIVKPKKELAFALLHALEFTGDRESLAQVERIIKRELSAKLDGEVREAIDRCASSLKARLQREAERSQLLRAATDGPGEKLLRVAPSNSTDSVTLLLRSDPADDPSG